MLTITKEDIPSIAEGRIINKAQKRRMILYLVYTVAAMCLVMGTALVWDDHTWPRYIQTILGGLACIIPVLYYLTLLSKKVTKLTKELEKQL